MANYKKKFSKTYDKYVEKIYRFIFLKVDTQETAEDLTSQVFSKAWARVKQTDKRNEKIENLPAYIYQIARAEVANFHRDKAKYRIISTESSQLADPSANLEESQEKAREIEKLRLSLANLDDDCQNIIIWHYLEGMPYKEISQIIGKPEGTIRVIAHRALKELKDKIA